MQGSDWRSGHQYTAYDQLPYQAQILDPWEVPTVLADASRSVKRATRQGQDPGGLVVRVLWFAYRRLRGGRELRNDLLR